MSKVLITRAVPERFLEDLRQTAEVTVYPEELKPMTREQFLDESKDKTVVITMLSDRVDQEFMDHCPELKAVINLAVGYDNIDLDYAAAKGIIVCNTPDVLTETTAELAFTLMLVTARRIIEAAQMVQDSRWIGWAPYLMAGQDVYGKTVGIYGMGAIGRAFARRCSGFGMTILYHNRSRQEAAESELGVKYADFDELITTSDYVVCTAPLTAETAGKFNKDVFSRMKEDAIFINIGRGGHVIEEDLLHAVQHRKILAAGLDVLAEEPINKNHPFLAEPNIVVLPHIGSASVETRDAMIQLCVDNARRIINGEQPLTPVKMN
ncbi:2-hydroxyacid dehydrogenase [Macrococcus equipercicus]|uniref:D-lactate dehydrogenase n=1 Tax=Macrococcus equipercicus TaxID=69967 RepID=A0A9Q9F1S8_9STAP|nr:D-glycerate dehydrogenase [Macrococcus equipercicus]UTH14398.1 D-glycerate dehydrogenase [Macrococcus equipercicus]